MTHIHLGWLFVLSSSIPFLSAFGENAFEEYAGWFDVGMLLAPVFGEFSFNGGFDEGSFVALRLA